MGYSMRCRFHYVLLAAWVTALDGHSAVAEDAKTFDFQRFQSHEGAVSTGLPTGMTSGDFSSFDLGPDGVVYALPKSEGANSFQHLSIKLDAEPKQGFPSRSRTDSDNISWYLNPDSECPRSPLSPEQINTLVEHAARKHGVAADFASAVAWAESRFDRIRNSPKGARGPMQLMPGTAADLKVDDVCDPEENIDGGVRYLRALIDEFQNPLVAAAAYNAGPKAVRDHDGIPPYPETINYLAEILNFQLGLRSNVKRKASDAARERPADNGVVGAISAGRFVGGVMKF